MAALLRAIPLSLWRPARWSVASLPRRHPVRLASLLALRQASAAWRHKLDERVQTFRPIDRPEVMFAASDSDVAECVYWLGLDSYEGRAVALWEALCRRAAHVLEIGGNIGVFAVPGGRVCAGRYVVVEPVPRVAAALKRNLDLNGLSGVELLEAASIPGAARQRVMLDVPSENRSMPVGAHLREGVEIGERDSEGLIEVEGIPFRELVAGADVLKIDAEGIECALLESAREEIGANRPTMILEVLPEARKLAQLVAQLAEAHGYRLTVLPEWGGLAPVEVPFAQFTAAVPQRFNSKNVVLSVDDLATLTDGRIRAVPHAA